jgi:hypothetical protein
MRRGFHSSIADLLGWQARQSGYPRFTRSDHQPDVDSQPISALATILMKQNRQLLLAVFLRAE